MMTNRMLMTSCTMVLLPLASLAQRGFDSANAAADALIEAAARHDSAGLSAIFGPQGNAILTSGNPAQDRAEQSEFSKLAGAKHELEPDARNANRTILSIGDEDWPFPVPLVRSNGKWAFDPSEASAEMQARRIGEHELDAIEICAGYVEAQQEYASEDRDKDGLLEYALHMISAPEKQNGLYWEGSGEPLVPRGFAEATWDGQKKSAKPYHGYFFRILDGQGPNAPGGAHNYTVKNKLIGGFGLVAWPAQYEVTGIHTFIVNQDGAVYEKDIAPAPGGAVLPITRFDPDASWRPVE
jgi:hypothetical protein